MRRALQLFAMVRMCDADERRRALAEVPAVQVCNAVFRHHIVYVGTRGHHARARLEQGYNTRDSLRGDARQGEDRPPALAQAGPAYEVHLSSDAAVEATA